MKRISGKQFEKLSTLEEHRPYLRIYDDTTLIKALSIGPAQLKQIRKNCKKDIDKVILPKEIYKMTPHYQYGNIAMNYAYTMDWAKGFQQLNYWQEIEKNYSDYELLKFFKRLFQSLQEGHHEGVYSGDIWYQNILINEELDYRLLDFELGSIPIFLKNYDKVHQNYLARNEFLEYQVSDKMSLLLLFLYVLRDGKVPLTREPAKIKDIEYFQFPTFFEKELKILFQCDYFPESNNYFLDFFDSLLDTNYKLPYRKKRNLV